jgi:hypothetical protein
MERKPVNIVDRFPYCGVTFSSNTRHLFEHHYAVMAGKATLVTNALFSLEAHVGTLSVPDGAQLYYARIDPYLTYGCEIAIDVDTVGIKKLEDAQLTYLRHLLGLHPQSIHAALFSETGIMPIRYRRIILALQYAKYALSQQDSHFVKCTYQDAVSLFRQGKSGWVGDIQNCLSRLPVPVAMQVESLESIEGIEKLIEDVEKACAQDVFDGMQSTKTPLLSGPNRGISPESIQSVLRLRKALSQFITAEHGLRVEIERRSRRGDGTSANTDTCRCRYCDAPVENELHALFECNRLPSLVARRKAFFQSIANHSRMNLGYALENPLMVFHYLIEYSDTAPQLARYVYDLQTFFPL